MKCNFLKLTTEILNMKYLTLTAAAALALGLATTAAEANKPQAKPAEKCPPVHKVHHHKPHAHHQHHAHAAAAQTMPYWTLFGGVKAGYGFGTTHVKDNDNLFACGCGFDIDTSRSKLASRGLVGGLLAGADYTFCSGFMLGLEASANLSHIQGKLDKRSGTFNGQVVDNFLIKDRIRAEGSFDFAARIGQNVCNAIYPYFKLGLSISRFKLQHAVASFPTPFTRNFVVSSYPLSKHKWRPGLQLGFGFDMPVSCRVFFGAEYAHTFYRKVTNKIEVPLVPGVAETARLRARPDTDVITLRLTVRS
jgi:opacity protein-like surface antigen